MDGMAEPLWPRFRGAGHQWHEGAIGGLEWDVELAPGVSPISGWDWIAKRVIGRRSDASGLALPKFDLTTPSTGRQSQMRLSASPRPALPAP